MDLDPVHVRSLLAITRYGGYGRAAEALYLTQPAVSRHVRRLEEQLGETLFTRRGRGVELTGFGERAVAELAEVLASHDRAVARLLGSEAAPFVLGTVEHVVDPLLPRVLGVVREKLGERPVRVRVERSRDLVPGVERGEVDAAIVFTPGGGEAVELAPLALRWWVASDGSDEIHGPLPVVAYDPPCGLRDLALERLGQLGIEAEITAESPHLFGVQAAARQGLGYALLAEGADGLRAVGEGPLAEPIEARLWLLVSPEWRALVAPLRTAVREAGERAGAVA